MLFTERICEIRTEVICSLAAAETEDAADEAGTVDSDDELQFTDSEPETLGVVAVADVSIADSDASETFSTDAVTFDADLFAAGKGDAGAVPVSSRGRMGRLMPVR